ncbi:hypothetical protein OAJ83_02255 [Candidatus Nitrosopelagicus sp.]|jgi:hypothetical protein|nr:hypothetical protein [Candidatus Nitrosopelagicus sp.]
MENNIQALVGAFVGIAILLGISVQILGNSVADCSDLPGYSTASPPTHTGWASACEDQNEQTQSAFALLVIVLIVVAAVVILTVVKML